MSYVGLILGNPSILSVAIISLIFIVSLGLFFSGKFSSNSRSKNPFATDLVRPPQPLVIDQNVRDRVLKEGFAIKKVPNNLDAVVVGSGIGGLAVAAIMAKAGKKVLVLEQHDQAGGCCHTFIEKGFEFDVGIHYCGELGDGTMTRVLIDQLTEGQLVWEKEDEIFDVIAIGDLGKKKFFEIKSGSVEEYRDNLVRQFPEEVDAIDKFMALLKRNKAQSSRAVIVKILPKWLSRILVSTGIIHLITRKFAEAKRSVDEVVSGLTDNKDLRAVLSYCFGDYGTPPDKSPFWQQTQLMSHFMSGGYYPRGGASEIAYHLIPTIEKAGGKCLVRAPVSEIVLNKEGKATGVVVRKGSNNHTISASMVISDAGVYNTAKLLSKKLTPSISQVVGKKGGLQNGYGGFSLFVGLKGSSEDLKLPPIQCWSFNNNELSKSFWKYLNQSVSDIVEGDIPMVFISFPSAKDSTWERRYPGKSACTVVTFVNWNWFQEWEDERVMHRGDGYNSVKDAIAKTLWKQVLDIYPQLEDKVEYFEAGSPLSNNYYLGATKGEMYGLDHNMERFSAGAALALHPQTDVPNLYMTGQDVWSGGFSGGLYGAVVSSCHTLNRNVLMDIINLKGRISKERTDSH